MGASVWDTSGQSWQTCTILDACGNTEVGGAIHVQSEDSMKRWSVSAAGAFTMIRKRQKDSLQAEQTALRSGILRTTPTGTHLAQSQDVSLRSPINVNQKSKCRCCCWR